MNIKLIIVIVLISLAMIFVVQNVAAVEVSFFFWKFALSRSLLIFFSMVAGFVLGWTSHLFFSFRRPKSDSIDDKATSFPRPS